MKMAIGTFLILAIALISPLVAQPAKPDLTEVQKLKAQLLKVQLQLAAKERDLATCNIELLQAPAQSMEQEFLKQVEAPAGSTWDWARMTFKPPVK